MCPADEEVWIADFFFQVDVHGSDSLVYSSGFRRQTEYSVVPDGTFPKQAGKPGNELPGYCLPSSLTGLIGIRIGKLRTR